MSGGKGAGRLFCFPFEESKIHRENPLPLPRKRIFSVGTGEARSASPADVDSPFCIQKATATLRSAFCTLHSAFCIKKSTPQGASACRKVFSTSCRTVEKGARCLFLRPEGVQWYSERAKKWQNNAKMVGIRCPDHFSL